MAHGKRDFKSSKRKCNKNVDINVNTSARFNNYICFT